MIVAVVDAQTLVDALGLGAVYALMAVGIGLVFGVLRLVNFAYGQLIMAGAFTLAYASRANWSTWESIVACFAVVIGLSLAMELTVFRPLRTQTPAVMLVATFAVSFLLQSVALLTVLKVQGQLGIPASTVAQLSQAVTVAGVDIRKVTIVSLVVTPLALGLLALLLGRTTVGLQMRAAAADFTTARLLGISANRVIGFAVLLAGVIAAVVAVLLTARTPYVQSDFGLHDMIYVLVGVVVGGIDRLWTATLGGFTIGFASGVIYGALPTDQTAYLPSVLFTLVLVVLLVRPAGLFAPRGTSTVERV
jgi:branched-chain amino acid transport system permease protein